MKIYRNNINGIREALAKKWAEGKCWWAIGRDGPGRLTTYMQVSGKGRAYLDLIPYRRFWI
jgi:hypothetical protein